MPINLTRLKDARLKVAELLLADPIYLPVFIRLEQEIAALEASNDAVARARDIVQLHKATA